MGGVPETPLRDHHQDIHSATGWSKLDTVWEGVSVDILPKGVDTSAEYVMAFSDGGYTTNVPIEELTGGGAWIVFRYDGAPLGEGTWRAGPTPRASPQLLEERKVGARGSN